MCGPGCRGREQASLLLAFLAGAAFHGASGLRTTPSRPLATHAPLSANCAAFVEHFDSPGQQVCAGKSFGDPPASSARRLAIVVRGESFRSGQGQGDREDGVTSSSWTKQREASQSHLEHVVRPLEECGYKVDVFLATYGHRPNPVSRNATKDLVGFYKYSVRATLVVDPARKASYTQSRMYGEAMDLLSKYHHKRNVNYDAIFVIRHDVIFKQSLLELPDVQWHNFLFVFKELGFWDNRVGDVLQWVPWRYANCAVKCGLQGHHGDCLMEEAGPGNFGYILPGEHNSNTRSESNPLYKLVRGAPHERHTAVLLACGDPLGPEPARDGHTSIASLFAVDRTGVDSALAVLGKAFEKHVLTPNNQHVVDTHNKVDVMAHCWSPVPEAAFREAFHPVKLAIEDMGPLEAVFNGKPGVGHHYWGSIAWAYSAKRAMELLQQHESETGSVYHRVVFLRPDSLMLKDLDLDVVMLAANDPGVHGGSDDGNSADFHLAMSREVASGFAGLYDYLSWQHPAQSYHWIKSFVEGQLQSTILPDDIVSGQDEVRYWKIPSFLKGSCKGSKHMERLRAVGFGEPEARKLGLDC